jgi:hypothetical protein
MSLTLKLLPSFQHPARFMGQGNKPDYKRLSLPPNFEDYETVPTEHNEFVFHLLCTIFLPAVHL